MPRHAAGGKSNPESRSERGRPSPIYHFHLPDPEAILPPVTPRWTNFVTLLTAPAALGAVAAYCADWHWIFDLAACFQVQVFGWLALGALILALARKWWRAAAFTAFAALAGSAILPEWTSSDNFPGIGESPPGLRVLSLNLLHSNTKGHFRLLEVVRKLAPDVIWCAEYTPAWRDVFHRNLPAYQHRCEHPKGGPFGVALLSRIPLTSAEIFELGHSWTPACRATLQLPSGEIGLLGVHPPPPGLSYRRTRERDVSLAAIPAALDSLPKDCVVVGDFNATPWNAPFSQLRERAGLSRGTTSSWLPTWPAMLPAPLRVPIDHILTTGDLATNEPKLGAHFGSDHLPLFAVVRARR